LASFISENIVLVLAFVILLIMIINLELRTTFSSVKKLTIDELTSLINSSRVLLIDLRKTDDYQKGHIVNAKNYSMDELDTLKINKVDYVVTYSSNDNESIKAAKILNKAGIENICYLDGGLATWLDNNMPLSGEDK
tara:strand:+ start:364 stop:774 length:411 start_codon:yes stop_codon:yes gene_type:complete